MVVCSGITVKRCLGKSLGVVVVRSWLGSGEVIGNLSSRYESIWVYIWEGAEEKVCKKGVGSLSPQIHQSRHSFVMWLRQLLVLLLIPSFGYYAVTTQ